MGIRPHYGLLQRLDIGGHLLEALGAEMEAMLMADFEMELLLFLKQHSNDGAALKAAVEQIVQKVKDEKYTEQDCRELLRSLESRIAFSGMGIGVERKPPEWADLVKTALEHVSGAEYLRRVAEVVRRQKAKQRKPKKPKPKKAKPKKAKPKKAKPKKAKPKKAKPKKAKRKKK